MDTKKEYKWEDGMGKKGRKSCNPGRKSCNLNDPLIQLVLTRKKDEIEKRIKEEAFKIESLEHIRDLIRENKILVKIGNGNGSNGSADKNTKSTSTDNLIEK